MNLQGFQKVVVIYFYIQIRTHLCTCSVSCFPLSGFPKVYKLRVPQNLVLPRPSSPSAAGFSCSTWQCSSPCSRFLFKLQSVSVQGSKAGGRAERSESSRGDGAPCLRQVPPDRPSPSQPISPKCCSSCYWQYLSFFQTRQYLNYSPPAG